MREALRQLELEGLVTIIPNKGAYVVGISQKDIKDIYEIRSRLEGLCAKWAAENITKEQLDELEENIFLSDFHATKGNAEQMVELDNKFHEILYDRKWQSRNYGMCFPIFITMPSASERSHFPIRTGQWIRINEHRRIVEALKQHDAQTGRKAVPDQHIMQYH